MRPPAPPLPPLLDVDSGPDSGLPSGPRWKKLLPLTALVAAGGIYAAILSINWNPHFDARTDAQVGFASQTPEGVMRPLSNGNIVARLSTVQVNFTAQERVFLVLLGLHANRRVSLYVPARVDDEAPLYAGKVRNEVNALLSAPVTGGAERILAVLCHTKLPVATVQKAAERVLETAGGPEVIKPLELGCAEQSVLVQVPATDASGAQGTGSGAPNK